MLNKSSLIVAQKQLIDTFGDSKCDLPTTSRNPSLKHINNKNHESNKTTKHKKKLQT